VHPGGDIRALCDLFGLSIAGAYRYTGVLGVAGVSVQGADHADQPNR
jgi:hypothetical protein